MIEFSLLLSSTLSFFSPFSFYFFTRKARHARRNLQKYGSFISGAQMRRIALGLRRLQKEWKKIARQPKCHGPPRIFFVSRAIRFYLYRYNSCAIFCVRRKSVLLYFTARLTAAAAEHFCGHLNILYKAYQIQSARFTAIRFSRGPREKRTKKNANCFGSRRFSLADWRSRNIDESSFNDRHRYSFYRARRGRSISQ